MAIPPVNSSAPVLTGTVDREYEVLIEALDQREKKFVQKTISLSEAKKRFEELRTNFPRCIFLTGLNPLQVQICREFLVLRRLPGIAQLRARTLDDPTPFKVADLIDDTLVLALRVIRMWREQRPDLAMMALLQLRDPFNRLCSCFKPAQVESIQALVGISTTFRKTAPFWPARSLC